MADLRSVMDKVIKLRELAARATTAAEADAAAGAAAALIAKYQIDEADLGPSGAETAADIDEDPDPLFRARRVDGWRSVLCAGLAKDHGCFAYNNAVGLHVVGRHADMGLVRYLFAWLSTEIVRLSMVERGRAAQNAFRLGATIGALRAMRAAREKVVAEAPTGASLAMVLVDRVTAAKLWKQSANPSARYSGGGRAATSDRSGAIKRGIEAGGRIHVGAALPGGRLALPSGR